MFGAPPDYQPTPIDLPETTDKHGNPIAIGTRVRSFDFDHRDLDGENACYIEGVGTGAVRHFGTPSYCIRIERRVFSGWERTDDLGVENIAPINGLRALRGHTDGVEVID
jgi:hypothetical protein